MTPNIGTEVSGIQLSSLTTQQRDELALWVAERGLVIFRKQDFVDQGIDWLREFGTYFGRLHVHQWGVHPKDAPELTVVYRDSDKGSYFDNQSEGNLNTVSWHTGMFNTEKRLSSTTSLLWYRPADETSCRHVIRSQPTWGHIPVYTEWTRVRWRHALRELHDCI